jgi:hypothetical protein
MIQKLTKIKSDDRVVNLIQDQTNSTINDILDSQIIDSVLLTSVSLVTGDNTVSHKLGRKLVGWFIVRQRSAGTVYDKQDSNSLSESNLILNSSANMTVDIYVF